MLHRSSRLDALRGRLRQRRYLALLRHPAVVVIGGLIGLGFLWIAITGYLAQQQAKALATRLQQVQVLMAQGRIDDARRLGQDVPAMADRVQHLTSGPAWWIGAQLPLVGEPLASARQTADVLGEVGDRAVPKLLRVAEQIDPAHLRVNGHTIRLAPLEAAAPTLADTDRVLAHALRQLDGGRSWLPVLDAGRAALREHVQVVHGYVDAAARATRVLPTMLGGHGVRRYFIALQNEAELRGTGGLPGAFAIAAARNGSVTFERFESDAVLLPERTGQKVDTGLRFGSEYDELYGPSDPTREFQDSNTSPDFPTAARIWIAMWQKVSGQHVDGALALDPTAISYFLRATGPAPVAGYGGDITADDVVNLTERDEYVLFPNTAARKDFLVAVLKAAAHKVTSGAGSPFALLQSLGQSATEQRLLAWYEDPAIERAIQETNYAGTLPSAGDRRPFSAVVLNNAAAGKLDYYLQRSVNYSRTGCGPRRDVVVTITLTNTAPGKGLPAYVTSRLDDARRTAKPGDNRSLLDYFATPGARLQSVTVNGRAGVASVHGYRGLVVFRMDLELPRGRTQTITLHLDEPAGEGAPRTWRQPGVTPIDVQAFSQNCA